MAQFIDVQKMVEDNQFEFEKRQTQSPAIRYQETTPVFVTYYHIDNDSTTTDAGFIDIASILGSRSPIRFERIKNLPIYEVDPIVLNLDDLDQGLDSTYEGDAVILPGTVHPLQNDFFVIPTLHDNYVFRVTSIHYDNVTPDNYYRIDFQLEVIDEEYVNFLEKQTPDNKKEVCLFNNIGLSDSSCIIREDAFVKIRDLKKITSDMVKAYIAMFYNDRYNCLIGVLDEHMMQGIYDPYQAEFINKHKLFDGTEGFMEYIFEDQVNDPRKRLKYEKSVYRFLENPDVSRLNQFFFAYSPGVTYPTSVFHRWSDRHVNVVDIPKYLPVNKMHIFTSEFVDSVKLNAPMNTEYGDLLKRYIRKENIKLGDISKNISDELVYLNDSLEVFFITPLILYIVNEVIKKETHIEKRI